MKEKRQLDTSRVLLSPSLNGNKTKIELPRTLFSVSALHCNFVFKPYHALGRLEGNCTPLLIIYVVGMNEAGTWQCFLT